MLIDSKKAVIVGETKLCIKCAEHLVSNGWKVVFVVSDDKIVIDWAKDNQILALPAFKLSTISEKNFYLFSIINPNIIPKSFLENKNILLALNYHDSLLPKYAGINSTTWAIINNEKQHGATLHQIKLGIDDGDIVAQSIIDIDKNETAVSLNLKCSECLLELFKEVIAKIDAGTLKFHKQEPTNRSYYGLKTIPDNYGSINGISDFGYIHRLVRGLSFGEGYDNPVATVKVRINDDFYIIENFNIELVKEDHDKSDKYNKDKVLFDKIRDIYGNKTDLKIKAKDMLQKYALTVDDLQYLSNIKVSERKHKKQILKFFNDHTDVSPKVFGHVTGKLNDKKYAKDIDIPNGLASNVTLTLVYFILVRYFREDFIVSLYLSDKTIPENLRNLIENRNFIYASKDLLAKSFIELEEYLDQAKKEHYILTKDFGYRYKVQTLTDIAIAIGEVTSTDRHNMVVRISNNKIEIQGDSDIQIQIDSIAETLRSMLSKNIKKEAASKDLRYLNILSQEQYQKIVIDYNETDRDYPIDKTIHQLFEEQALRTPNNIAVVYEDITLTYQELNNKANQLANYLLQNYDIKPDDLIALYLDRNEQMLIAILGVLKAGGAYVPLDLNYPEERIRYILKSIKTKIKAVLTNDVYTKKIHQIVERGIKKSDVLTVANKEIMKQKNINPITLTKSNNLSYVLYTSGTMGNPKGVMIEHRGVVNTILSLYHVYDFNKGDKTTAFTSYTFDVSVSEFFVALFKGAELHLLSESIKKDVFSLSNYVKSIGINYLYLPPAMLSVFPKINYDTLKGIVYAGEPCDRETGKYWSGKYNLYNYYGPTETTIYATGKQILEGDTHLIGSPIYNVKCYVLDKNLVLLPIGAIGELYIGGEGLARGYLNSSELDKRFLINPFQTKEEKLRNKNSRLYKTGDLVRWQPDGNIEYIGRNDFQVKLKGYRIELGDVENKLLSYSGIKQAVVLMKERIIGQVNNKYLLAYYVSDKKLDEVKIHAYLATQLPEYMLPQILMYINSLPLTPSGKLNKKALPEPELIIQSEHTPPKNELEKNICELYAQVLNLSTTQIGIKSDFFKMGGDSISTILLVSRIRQRLKLNVSVKDIFTHRNIEQLIVNVFTNQGYQKKDTVNIKWENNPIGQSNLLPIQEWFFDNIKSGFFPKYHHWNQSFLIKTPELDMGILKLSVRKLLEHHDAFRLRYKNFQQYYTKMDFAKESEKIKKINISDLSAEEIKKKLEKTQSNFNLERGPIYIIAYLYGYKDKTARLFFALHHLIVDSVSWRILTHDIAKLYQLLQKQNNINKTSQELLGQKGTSYRQWTEEVKNYKLNQEELNYWNDILKDYEPPTRSNRNTSYERFLLTPLFTQKLQTKANETYHTQANDILLSALARTLSQIFSRQVNHITFEGHGREEINKEIDIIKTMGWFTTMYPVKLINKSTIPDLIKTTKESLKNIPNKGVGYGALKGYKNLPAISFNYLGQINSTEDFWTIADHMISVNPQNRSCNIIDIYGYVTNNTLKFHIQCNSNSLCNARAFTKQFKTDLETIIEFCSNSARTYLTSSDINKIIKQEYLDVIQENIEVEDIYLANNLQQGFIYHATRQGKTDDAYLSQFIWEYQASIDKDKFKQAWQLSQKKYPALRLRFAWDSELIQIIDRNQDLDFRYADLTDPLKTTISDHKSQINKIIDQDRQERYDLRKGNLIRIYLIKSSENAYTCICSMHHIILDGWSTALLIDSMHEIYLQLLTNNQPQIFEDMTYKKAQHYLQEYQNKNQEYWDRQIKQIEDRVDSRYLLKPSVRNIEIKNHMRVEQEKEKRIKITGQKFGRLKEVCQNNAITINAVIQYVWHKILHIYGISDTTVVGTVVSGRVIPIDNIENSIGLFLNTLPIVFVHDNKSNILDQLKITQNLINEANSKSNINLANLQSEGERLFDSLLVYENFPPPKHITGIKYGNIQEIFKVDYPLAVIVYEKNQALTIKLRYAGELFSQKTISHLLNKLLFFIEQISENPYKKTLSYLNQEEYKRIIIDYNKTEKDFPANKTIHEMFEEQVLKTPNNIAVVYEDKKLTYKELNTKANQLANYMLKNYDIKPEDLIALLLDRSEYMIVSILAVLKTGAAYVPIDPNFPEKRIKYILEDTKAKIVIKSKNIVYKTHHNKVIAVDAEEFNQILQKEEASNPKVNISSTNLIYVLYTSGTTGRPKGIMLEHAACVNRILEMVYISQITPHSKILFKTNYVFDVSFSDIFVALLTGASLFVTKEVFNIDEISIKFKKYLIDVCHFTPSQFNAIKNIKGIELFKTLKTLHFSGEALDLKLLKNINKNVKCVNYYGPTETGEITFDNCNSFASSRVLIGYPLSNTKLFILDKNLMPLPIGAVGELYLGGICLARGYLGNSAFTKEKFICNPFQTPKEKSKNINNKIYKTGDLVRMLSSGNIEYMGRNDFQVKIRGFRVELEEIENKLRSYQGIKQSTVIVSEELNNKQLIAYYVSDKKLEEQKIKDYLLNLLPNYMIPSAFVYMQKLPLTGNGKLDKKALPEPEYMEADSYIAPKNKQERLVCEAFTSVLGIPKIGVNDDFFSLGGNSILAIKLTAVLQENFDIHMADIFNLRTPGKLAESSVFGKNFLYHKLNLVRLAYKKKRNYNKYINIKSQDLSAYKKAIKNLNIDISTTKSINNTLLTGSTGYLGCNILNQLLELTKYKIYLLIRAISQLEAIEKINKKYQFYFDELLDNVIGKRIFVINADVEKKHFGLSQSEYRTLTTKIDSVIHAAALVKHYGEYDVFYSANVNATINLLEFTRLTKLKDFHYISTIGVLQFTDLNSRKYIYTENDLPNSAAVLNGVYAKTKLLGEHQVIRYRKYKMHCSIYRLGNLAFISKNYRAQENIEGNAFYNWLKCLFAVKCSTKIINTVEISQVDLAAEAIVKIFDKKSVSNQTYHLFNPYLFDMTDVFKSNDCKILSIESFVDRIKQHIKEGSYYDLIVRFLLRQGWIDWWNRRSIDIRVLQDKTQYILKLLNFKWPLISDKIICNYLDSLKLTGCTMTNKAKIFSILDEVVPTIPAPVFWMDINSVGLGGNDLVFEVVGATANRKMVIGKTPHDYYPKDIADAIVKNIRRVIKEKKPIEFEESIRDMQTGKTRIFLARRAPLFDDSGIDVVGTIVTAIEITDRKEKERLNVENEAQRAKSREQEKFKTVVDQVVHDIRSPLASLQITMEAYKEIPEQARTTLRRAVTSITNIADSLLDKYKNDDNKINAKNKLSENVFLSLVLLELLSNKEHQYKNLPIKLNLSFDPKGYFAFVRGNQTDFERMISNLINNSVDAFEGKEGRIDLKVDVDSNEIKVIIQDNGKGMSQDVINKIMSNEAVTVGKENGHGIGLGQVRDTLQACKGKMSIESKIGVGTKFTLTFAKTENPGWIAEKIEFFQDDMIVVLDDDPSIHEVWESRFGIYEPKVQMQHFHSGQSAIKFINDMTAQEKEKVLFLSDFELINQELNGLQVIEKLYLQQRSILVTGYYNKQSVQEQADKVGVKILPKQLSPYIPIEINMDSSSKSKNPVEKPADKLKAVDLVLIDDNDAFLDSLLVFLENKGKIVDGYYDPDRFLEKASEYDKNTRICIDYDFGKHRKNGIKLAKQLHASGYTRLYILTGKDLEKEKVPNYLTVISKSDMDKLYNLVEVVQKNIQSIVFQS